jgi:hypothetical protein
MGGAGLDTGVHRARGAETGIQGPQLLVADLGGVLEVPVISRVKGIVDLKSGLLPAIEGNSLMVEPLIQKH